MKQFSNFRGVIVAAGLAVSLLGQALTVLPAEAVAARPIGRPHVAKPQPWPATPVDRQFGQAAARRAEESWEETRANGRMALQEQLSAADQTSLTSPKVTGDNTQTPLAPSASWTAGGQSGSFTWSYPFQVPPTAAGPVPELSLNYDSGSVDGRLPSTNNQTSAIGEGFDITHSYVERTYGSCDADGQNGKYDRCWQGDQVTLVLNGQANRLVKVNDTAYRLEHDDASKVELLTGKMANGDNDGEYWQVTTGDGTTFSFGLDKLPGAGADAPLTDSVWTVPVAGDDAGEPCHGATFADSFCRQAWRWNLDLVTDLQGNSATYWYAAEHNNYAKNGNVDVAGTDYVRGGYLERIDYGLRADTLFNNDANGQPNVVHPAPQRVVFTVGERCLQSGTACDSLTSTTKDNWPDVPFDSICKDGDKCTGDLAPTFFTRKLLTGVTTEVRIDGSLQPVDTWDLNQQWWDAGEVDGPADQTLWLQSLTRTGHSSGGATALPSIKFTGRTLDNRVDAGSDDIIPLGKPRIATITSETGAITTVNYSSPDCWHADGTRGDRLPSSRDSNKMRCFPSYWSPYGATPQLDWFHKYVVTAVDQADPGGGARDIVTEYIYGDGDSTSDDGAWHFAAQPMTPKRQQTWSEWRGYQKVTTLVGDPAESVRSKSVDFYMRGMDGDRNADGTTKSVSVTGVDAATLTDSNQLSGEPREHVEYDGLNKDGTTGRKLRSTVSDYWASNTESQTFPAETIDGVTYPSVTIKAWMVRTSKKTDRTALVSGGERGVAQETTFDTYGMPTDAESYSIPDLASPGIHKDVVCAHTWYARNPAVGLTALVSRTQTVAVGCAETPSLPSSSATAGDVVSDTATLYDASVAGSPTGWDHQTPTDGLARIVQRPTGYSSGAPSGWQTVTNTSYDSLGRAVAMTNVKGDTANTTYVPSGAGVPQSMKLEKPLVRTGLKRESTLTVLDPMRGVPLSVTDQNDKVTETTYDDLGRAKSVWTPATPRANGAPPAAKFNYYIGHRKDDGTTDESWVSTSKIVGNTTTYTTSFQFFDSMLRPLQTQDPSPLGGRMVTETSYDSRGLAYREYSGVYLSGDPDGVRQGMMNGRAQHQVDTTYDGAGRAVKQELSVMGVAKPDYTTSWDYAGDSVGITPAVGGTATREYTDPLGRVSERREYNGGSPTTTDFTATKFSYLKTGQLGSVTGPGGAVWSYTYDLYGRQVTAADPDKGTATTTYTTLDQVDTTKDARGTVLLYDYDPLGRKTAEYAGSRTSTNLQAEWGYDAVSGAVGYPSSSTRHVGTALYKRNITAYDEMYRPESTQLVLPSTDPLVSSGAVPATLTQSTYYNHDGSVQSTGEPAVAGLPSELVSMKYDSVGLPTSMQGISGLVLDTVYDEFGKPMQLNYGLSTSTNNQAYVTNEYETGTDRLTRSYVTDLVHSYMPQDLHYSYTASGRVTEIRDPSTQGGNMPGSYSIQCFKADGHGRLTDAWTPKTDDCATAPSVSALGGAGPYWTSWTYNVDGSRKSQTGHGGLGLTATTYTYNATCTGSVTRTHALAKTSTTAPDGTVTPNSYGCDQLGNTITRPGTQATQTLTWNAEGRMSRETEPAVGTKLAIDTSYIYDADGNLLIRRPTNDVGTTRLYLGATEVDSAKSTATSAPVVTGLRYYSFAGSVMAVRTATKGVAGSNVSFLFGDTHGTNTLTLSAAKLDVVKRFVGPFGTTRGGGFGTWVDDKRFLGAPADKESGLTHIGAREYDPNLGRFISVDPLLDTSDGQSLNGYTYSDNNPVTLSDPTGTRACADEDCHEYVPAVPNYTNTNSAPETPAPQSPAQDDRSVPESSPKPDAGISTSTYVCIESSPPIRGYEDMGFDPDHTPLWFKVVQFVSYRVYIDGALQGSRGEVKEGLTTASGGIVPTVTGEGVGHASQRWGSYGRHSERTALGSMGKGALRVAAKVFSVPVGAFVTEADYIIDPDPIPAYLTSDPTVATSYSNPIGGETYTTQSPAPSLGAYVCGYGA